MNFFKTDAQVKRRKELDEQADYVRRGGSLNIFRPDDIMDLQEYAMDIKDVQLYDHLNTFWHGQKAVRS